MDMIPKVDLNNDAVVALLLALLIAFITWLAKSFIEKPFENSRETFFRFVEARIQILSVARAHLINISLFPTQPGEKDKLKEMLLQDRTTGFLSRKMLNDVFEIATEKSVNEKKLFATIASIDKELASQIHAIHRDYSFYLRFAGNSPAKKILGYATVMLKSVLLIGIVITTSFFLIRALLSVSWVLLVLTLTFALVLAWLFEKRLLRRPHR